MNSLQQRAPAQDNPPWVNWVVLGVVVGAVYCVFHFRPFRGPDSREHPTVDRPLPSLGLQGLLETEEVVALQDVEGQVVVLSFWGPWSPDSFELVMHLYALQRELASRKDFRLLAVTCGRPNAAENFKQLKTDTETMLDRLGIRLPVYADPGQRTRGGVEILRLTTGIQTQILYPTTLVLDRKGFVRGVWEGCRPETGEEVRNSVLRLLNEGQSP